MRSSRTDTRMDTRLADGFASGYAAGYAARGRIRGSRPDTRTDTRPDTRPDARPVLARRENRIQEGKWHRDSEVLFIFLEKRCEQFPIFPSPSLPGRRPGQRG